MIYLGLLGLLITLVAAAVAWRGGAHVWAALLVAAGLTIAEVAVGWWLSCLVVIAAVGVVLYRRSRTSAQVQRWSRRGRRKLGVASSWDVLSRASALAMHRKSGVVRPSLAGEGEWWHDFVWWSWWVKRWTVRTTEIAIRMARAGWLAVWSPIEMVTLVFGGPRKGKTAWLANVILDAPGACLATTTRTDLVALTFGLRTRGGRPGYIFNATGLAGYPSTITFDPLTGCEDPVTAMDRATDMLSGDSGSGESGDRKHWIGQARRVLGTMMHAAALGGLSMLDVQQWVAATDKHHKTITRLLARSPMPAYVADAVQFLETNDRTRTSITNGITPALAWLGSPAAMAAATRSDAPFDVMKLLTERGTVYLLGAEAGHTAPLLAALTGYIAREARRIAALDTSVSKNGRLDPNLTMALDECALVCTIPLDDWSADMGGRGVTIVACFQSRADLHGRWGRHGSSRIMNNSGTVMLFGGTKDLEDLGHWSALAGMRDERVPSLTSSGQVTGYSVRNVPVLSHEQIKNLPAFRTLVFCDGMPVVIGRIKRAWKRRDVRAQMKLEGRATQAIVKAVEAEHERKAAGSPSLDQWAVSGSGEVERVESPTSERRVLSGRVGDSDATH